METSVLEAPFAGLPATAENHFRVHFFAAIEALSRFVDELDAPGLRERHQFLQLYRDELTGVFPHTYSQWPKQVLEWERLHEKWFPLRELSRAHDVSIPDRLTILLVGLVEEDRRFGTLLADLQAPLPHRRLSLELLGRVMSPVSCHDDPLHVVERLLEEGYLEAIDKDVPRSEWALRVPNAIWTTLRGRLPPSVPGMRYHPPKAFPPMSELVLPAPFLRRLARAATLVSKGNVRVIVVQGPRGSDRLAALGALAGSSGHGLIEVTKRQGDFSGLGPLCTLTEALPVFTFDIGPGETAQLPGMPGYVGPVGVMIGREGGLNGRGLDQAMTLTMPSLGPGERRRCWEAALGHAAGSDLDAIVERYHLPGAYIRRIGSAARTEAVLDGRAHVALADVQRARRSLGRELLDTLAERLEHGASEKDAWSYLVASDSVRNRLHELERRCHHRERLLDQLGPAFGSATNRGVRALFAGPSGTGKTLAARLLSARLGVDLYRVDLAAVINKYIGETEKNLHRVFTAAEDLDILLLLDEGDALLGSRTEVKTANDRYANLETNYLLQRLEHYDGVVIITTNLGENIDRAFQRRMDLVIDFLPPQPDERWELWQLHLPTRHKVNDDFLEVMSTQCELTGGQIRNAAQLATLLALDDGRPLSRPHLEAALLSEYRKAGATYPLEQTRTSGRSVATHAFLETLTR